MKYQYEPWGAAAQGMQAGTEVAATILGMQMKKEEAGQKTKLFNETMADIAHKNKVIGTVGGIIDTVSDLDDQGKAAVAQTLSRFGLNPGYEIQNKHLPEIQTLLKENPILTDTVNAHRVRYLDEQIKSLDPNNPASKDAAAAIEAKKARYLLGSEEARKISHTQSEAKKATAAEKAAEYKEPKPKTWEEKAIEEKWTAKEIAAEKARIAREGRTPAEHETWAQTVDDEGYPIQVSNRGRTMAMPGAAEKKAKTEKLKTLEKQISDAESDIAKGKIDPFTQADIDKFNEKRREIDGQEPYKLETVEKNWLSKDKTRLARLPGASVEAPPAAAAAKAPPRPKAVSADAKWDGTNWYRVVNGQKQIWQPKVK